MPNASATKALTPVLPAGREPCHCALVRRAARHITGLYDEALAPVDLRLSQYSLLAGIDRAGSIGLTPLAAALGMDRTTLTRNLAPLTARKLVALETESGRTKVARLTSRGRTLLAEAYPHWLEAQRRFTKTLGTQHLDTLAALGAVARA